MRSDNSSALFTLYVSLPVTCTGCTPAVLLVSRLVVCIPYPPQSLDHSARCGSFIIQLHGSLTVVKAMCLERGGLLLMGRCLDVIETMFGLTVQPALQIIDRASRGDLTDLPGQQRPCSMSVAIVHYVLWTFLRLPDAVMKFSPSDSCPVG